MKSVENNNPHSKLQINVFLDVSPDATSTANPVLKIATADRLVEAHLTSGSFVLCICINIYSFHGILGTLLLRLLLYTP
jgi:hypothetical protein